MTKPADKFFDRQWWKSFIVAILATTVSIILTFGTASLVDHIKLKKERRLTALMVMSSIESFSRHLDETLENTARCDTVAQYLCSLPADKLDQIPDDELWSLIEDNFSLYSVTHDQSAEDIFNSGIDTWKSIGNFQFIDNVGHTFSTMKQAENEWNEWVKEFTQQFYDVSKRSLASSGSHNVSFMLKDDDFRVQLMRIHLMRDWLRYSSEYFRYLNSVNMSLIGIPKDEVIRFTDTRETQKETGEVEPDIYDYMTDRIPADSLAAWH